MEQPQISRTSRQGRWVLAAAVLGSGMAILDGTVVNIALRSIGGTLDASVSQLQWVVNAYLVTLASFILVGGSLGDRFGRRRIFIVGTVSFAVASALCALAESPVQLILARLVQGLGAALLTPGSLAMIQGAFRTTDRARVIGQWAGLSGIAAALGPLLGGWIVDIATWRWIFWINVPLAAAVVLISIKHVPETSNPQSQRGFDLVGSALGAAGLGGITYAMIEAGGGRASYVLIAGVVGILALVSFVGWEHRTSGPLVPLPMFRERVFSVANAMTFLVYGALGAVMFFLVLQLQVTSGYSPFEAGLATLPVTAALVLLSSGSAALSDRIGPRLQMSLGPALCAVGVLLLQGVDGDSGYLTGVLPGITAFALGLAALVAPLTASVLAAAPDRLAGTASGINNAVARTGSLFAVAALPSAVGLTGEEYRDPSTFTAGYAAAMVVCAVLLFAGGAVSYVGLRPGERAAAGAPSP